MVEFTFELPGLPRRFSTTLGYSQTAAPTQAQVNTLGFICAVRLAPCFPTSYRLRDTRFYTGDGTQNPPYLDYVLNAAGSSASSLLSPPGICTVIEKRTALAGRKGKGRMYLPGVREDSHDNAGTFIPGHITFFNAVMANLKGDIEGQSWIGNLMLFGHVTNPVPRQITSLVCRPRIGTQVNRLRKQP